jgi:hypothetical protein
MEVATSPVEGIRPPVEVKTARERAEEKWMGAVVVVDSLTIDERCCLGLSDPTDERDQLTYVLGYD